MFSELFCIDTLSRATLKLKLLEETTSCDAVQKYLIASDFI